jgi:hypothetical protein
MSEFEQLYREVILDHYKAPRNHGLLDPADAVAEGQNPLCGDEIRVTVRFGEGDILEKGRAVRSARPPPRCSQSSSQAEPLRRSR